MSPLIYKYKGRIQKAQSIAPNMRHASLDAGHEHRDERAEDRAKEGQRANRKQGQKRDDEYELGDALAAVAVQIAHWVPSCLLRVSRAV